MTPKYLTTSEVAEMTGFRAQTIRKFATQYQGTKNSRRPKGLKGFKPNGSTWRFKPEDVRAFMEGR